MLPIKDRDASKDPNSFMMVGLMTAVITSIDDWRAFAQSILSISQQVACADALTQEMVPMRLGSLGLSIYFDEDAVDAEGTQLFPDRGLELVTKGVLAIRHMLALEGDVWVLRQKRLKPVFEQYRDMLQRFPTRFTEPANILTRTHVMLIPQQGVWHPYRLATFSGALAAHEAELSSVCALGLTVDKPGVPTNICKEDFNGSMDVQHDVEVGLLLHTVIPFDQRDTWLSAYHDFATRYDILKEFFEAPEHQWYIERNRFVDSHFGAWVRTYRRPGHHFQTGFINQETWLLYWVPRGQEAADYDRPLPGNAPLRIHKKFKDDKAMQESARMLAELYEIPLWKEAAPHLRKQQVSQFGEDSELSTAYTKMVAEICVARMKERQG